MVVVDGVLITAAFSKRRENNHADGAVAGSGFVPDDKYGAASLIRRRVQDDRQILMQPDISLFDLVVVGLALVMHVVAEIGRDEVVLGHVSASDIVGHFGERSDMCDAIGGVWVLIVGDVVKVDKGIVPDSILPAVDQWARRAADILLISLPGDALGLEEGDQMLGRGLGVYAGRVVVQDSEIGARLQP